MLKSCSSMPQVVAIKYDIKVSGILGRKKNMIAIRQQLLNLLLY